MAKKNRTPTQHSAVRRELRSEKYRLRVVASKKGYKRKAKHTQRSLEAYAKTLEPKNVHVFAYASIKPIKHF